MRPLNEREREAGPAAWTPSVNRIAQVWLQSGQGNARTQPASVPVQASLCTAHCLVACRVYAGTPFPCRGWGLHTQTGAGGKELGGDASYTLDNIFDETWSTEQVSRLLSLGDGCCPGRAVHRGWDMLHMAAGTLVFVQLAETR